MCIDFVLQQWLHQHASMLGYTSGFFFVDLLLYDSINYEMSKYEGGASAPVWLDAGAP